MAGDDEYRYATSPPNCPALKKANEAMKKCILKMIEDNPGLEQDVIDPDTGEFKRYISMKPGEDKKYAKCRKVWMDTYKAAGGNSEPVDQGLAHGELSRQCQCPKANGSGSLGVFVKDDTTSEPIAGAKVRISGQVTKQGTTTEGGRIAFEKVPAGKYRVNAYKEPYKEKWVNATVKADSTEQVEVLLTMEEPGSVLVKVVGETWFSNWVATSTDEIVKAFLGKKRTRPVADADVEVKERVADTPKTFPQTKTGKTDKEGYVLIKGLRHGSYWVSGKKGNWPTDRKQCVIHKPGRADPVELTIQSRKKFIIQIMKVSWGEVGTPFIEAKVVIGRMNVEIRDVERGITGMYTVWFTTAGVEVSFEPKLPVKGVSTKAPGNPSHFEAPRFFANKEITANSFENKNQKMNMSTAGVTFTFFDIITVYQVDMGETDEDVQFLGVGFTRGHFDMTFKGSKAT